MKPTKRPVTQSDIAAIAGCSQNTVTLALRGSPRISEPRRKEIHRIAENLGYRPSIAARGLRIGKSGLIGLYGVIDPLRSTFVSEILAALHTTQYKPVLGVNYQNVKPWYLGPWIDTLLSMQVEAIVSFNWNDVDSAPEWSKRVPLIFSGYQPSEVPHCDTIAIDRIAAVDMAIEYLCSKGHKRIDLLEPHYSHYVHEGYKQAMERRGLKPNVIKMSKETMPEFVNRYLDMRKANSSPATGVFAIPSALAVELYFAAQRRGIAINKDFQIVGYDLAQWIDHLGIPLTTVDQPMQELAKQTVATTLKRLAEPDLPPIRMKIPFKLNIRQQVV